MAERKSQLDALALDIQFFISEHEQDLSLQQNQQMQQCLNELQRSFQDLVEQTAARRDALQGHLQQTQQEVQLKVRLNQQLSSVCLWGCLLGVFWPRQIPRNLSRFQEPRFTNLKISCPSSHCGPALFLVLCV